MLETTIAGLRRALGAVRSEGKSVGFVPTMGYLHAGHLSLVDAAKRECDVVIVSLFVNPLQFAPNEDLARYPRDLERDLAMLARTRTDIVFAPSVEEMYPEPMATVVSLPELSATLEGKTRPTHFQGVATVVLKLLQIVQPDRIYFGQKDGQQVAVVRRMVRDLSVPVEVRVAPTLRDEDGLALSSRHVYLRPEDRPAALRLFQALQAGRSLLEGGERSPLLVEQEMTRVLAADPAVRIDYAAAVDAGTLARKDVLEGRVMLAVAAFVGATRLIDNLVLDVTPPSS